MRAAEDHLPAPTPGAKMMYLIRRRPGVSREELIMHWFANHMPGVIRAQEQAAANGRIHAHRYIATLFDAESAASGGWDGVAQLWWDQPLPRPDGPYGVTPRDTFQQKAEPYVPWATVEYVIVDGGRRLPVEPLTLNDPFPTTRSGFFKIVCLVAAREGADFEAMYRHWLTVHAPRVATALPEAGGFRYVVSLSLEPHLESYAGMVELYFDDASGWDRLTGTLGADGMDRWVAAERMLVFSAATEMIGIP